MKNRLPILSIALLLSSAYLVADEKFVHKEETVIENDTNRTKVVSIQKKEEQNQPSIAHQVGDKLHVQADKARAMAHNVADEVAYGAHIASDKAKEMGHKAADAAKEAGHTVKDDAIKAENKAEGYGRKALNVAKSASGKVADVAKGAGNKVANAALYVYHKAGDAVDAIGDKIHTATHHKNVGVQTEPVIPVNDNMVRVEHDTSTQQHIVVHENHVHETCNSKPVCN